MNRRSAALALGALLAATAAPTFADTWPPRPVQIVVPAPAASSLDIIARTLGERLAITWKQPVVVLNKAGAGGMLGMDTVAKAAPDGTTLGVGFNGPIAFGPHMYKKMPYDPAKALVPVVLTTSQPNVLAVPADLPVRNVAEFVAWAKKQDHGVSYGSVGNGSSSHLTMELFKAAAGFDAVHVPYGGSPPAAASLVSRETQALFSTEPALKPLLAAGRVRLLAATSLQRTDLLKDVPTLAESGYPGFEAIAWNGLFVPAGTPPEVIAKINQDVNAALKDPAVQEVFVRNGLVAGGGTPDAFRAYIDAESRKWGPIIRKAGISID